MPTKTTLRDIPDSNRAPRSGDGTADRLAQAALRLFDQKGFDATTIDDIAAAANVSRRTFFRHFPRKESVILFEQAFIQAELRDRLADPPAGVSVLDEFLASVPWILRQASLDPVRLRLRVQLVKSVPELASTERDADSATIETFATAYAKELGGGGENRVRAMALGGAIVAAANAALDESLGGADPVPLFEAAADSIRGWAPVRVTRPLVAIVQVPEGLTDEVAAALIQQALVGARGPEPTSAKARPKPKRG